MNEAYMSILCEYAAIKQEGYTDSLNMEDCFTKWSINEILELFIKEYSIKLPPHLSLTGEEYRTPKEVITEFINRMAYYYSISGDIRFFIAVKIGEELLCFFDIRLK